MTAFQQGLLVGGIGGACLAVAVIAAIGMFLEIGMGREDRKDLGETK